MVSNFKIMKTKCFLVFGLFITVAVLVSGCGKTDKNLASENADLKARVQQLEQQLNESSNQVASAGAQASQPASTRDAKNLLDEAQKEAEAAATALKSLSSQVETQKQKIDELARELADAQQAREKAEQALQLFQDKATHPDMAIPALMQLQALRCALPDNTLKFDGYQQNYAATQSAVKKLVDALPESGVRQAILDVLAVFTRINDICQTAAAKMEARTKTARANYDKFVDFGGMGPNDYVIAMGHDKILAPAEKDNAATAALRDQQVVSLRKDLDLGLKNLQALMSGPGN
jgi:outer membrane murein-binding lipoprotein Lpp